MFGKGSKTKIFCIIFLSIISILVFVSVICWFVVFGQTIEYMKATNQIGYYYGSTSAEDISLKMIAVAFTATVLKVLFALVLFVAFINARSGIRRVGSDYTADGLAMRKVRRISCVITHLFVSITNFFY